ncbi:hypothetical protein ON010_g9877 [Phytophthora cinnamomi]|nr:hypothetical protein ON010_g9877 [Phytophthora cinnamomi]
MVDIVEIFESVNVLMAKIPRDHPLAQENFVQVAAWLMADQEQEKAGSELDEANDSDLDLSTPKAKPPHAAVRIVYHVGTKAKAGVFIAPAAGIRTGHTCKRCPDKTQFDIRLHYSGLVGSPWR